MIAFEVTAHELAGFLLTAAERLAANSTLFKAMGNDPHAESASASAAKARRIAMSLIANGFIHSLNSGSLIVKGKL